MPHNWNIAALTRLLQRLALVGAGVVGFSLSTAAATLAGGCAGADTLLTLPKGFCATVFADHVGPARHMAVSRSGVLYVNTQGSSKDGAILALKDTKGDGRAEVVARSGEKTGGTGIALYKSWLYAESGDRIIRYALSDADVVPKDKAEIVVSGLPVTGSHTMHPFAIDASGNLLVDLGSATNSCQKDDRAEKSPGLDPCDELKMRGGIWRYDANKVGQAFSPAERFATGLRNAEGIDFDSEGRAYATQHGRDQLYENWPDRYSPQQGTDLPAEELVLLREGGDYGWPYCYYNPSQQKLVLGPEYGGDGKAQGRCSDKLAPIAAFPAHWAPNDLKMYGAQQFPEKFRGGAFIAFHGSWNRSVGPQGGYNVVFQPLKDGKASGKSVVFADGFRNGGHRPTGLAVGSDGALYVSDDEAGRIWRIVYKG